MWEAIGLGGTLVLLFRPLHQGPYQPWGQSMACLAGASEPLLANLGSPKFSQSARYLTANQHPPNAGGVYVGATESAWVGPWCNCYRDFTKDPPSPNQGYLAGASGYPSLKSARAPNVASNRWCRLEKPQGPSGALVVLQARRTTRDPNGPNGSHSASASICAR